MDEQFWREAFDRIYFAREHELCECRQCQADDASFYAEYLIDDHRALMWETYQRNHPDGQPRG